jgi:hypothetical protein
MWEIDEYNVWGKDGYNEPEEHLDDGESCSMEIEVWPNLYSDSDDPSDEPEESAAPESPKPALKRSAEFFQPVNNDSGSTDSAEHVPSTSANDDRKSPDAEADAKEGRKKLKKALKGDQGSLIEVDSIEVLFNNM